MEPPTWLWSYVPGLPPEKKNPSYSLSKPEKRRKKVSLLFFYWTERQKRSGVETRDNGGKGISHSPPFIIGFLNLVYFHVVVVVCLFFIKKLFRAPQEKTLRRSLYVYLYRFIYSFNLLFLQTHNHTTHIAPAICFFHLTVCPVPVIADVPHSS